MGSADFVSGWDTTILMVPFLGILVLYMFHLDSRFAAPKRAPKSRRFFCGVDPQDQPNMTDPDGQPWRSQSVRQIEAKLTPMAQSGGHDTMCQGVLRTSDSPAKLAL
jgi:hypothetical protein